MEKCIDIYSRLLIATITFVVPIIINLLATFKSGEKRRRELASATEEYLSKQTALELQANPHRAKETIAETYTKLTENDKNTKREINLLNPIIQFWNIAIFLALCFGFLLLSYLIRSNYLNLYNHSFSIIILLLSILCYFLALFFIIRILYTINKTKRIVEQ